MAGLLPKRWLLALAAALALVLAGCDGDASPAATAPLATVRPEATAATSTPTPSPSASPGSPESLTPGLRKILDDVATVRQLAPPPDLKITLIPRSQLPALLDDLLTAEDRGWFDHTTTLYRLLGHLGDDQDYLSIYKSFGTDAILGLYSPDHDQLWVVQDGDIGGIDNLTRPQQSTLAHEFVHALQDYHFDLGAIDERIIMDDRDIGLAWSAVVEGDAVIHENLYTRTYLVRIGGGGFVLSADAALPASVPVSITRELYFPYITGVTWVQGVLARDGIDAVNRMISDPPRGTAFALHPDLAATGWQPTTVALPDLASALGPGWRRESGGTLGEFGYGNYLQLRLGAADAASGAAGWAGDHYDVYVNGAESAAAFRIAFRDASEATEFAARQQRLLDAGGSAEAQGDMRLVTANDGDVTATLPPAGAEVLFTIASTRAAALAALVALAGG